MIVWYLLCGAWCVVPQSHCESKHISIDRLRVPSKILTVTNNFCCKTFSLIQCIYSEQMLDTTQTHSLTTEMAPKWMAKTRNICGWMNACADLLAHQQEKGSCKTNWQNNLLLRYFGTSLRSMCRVRTAIPRELNEIPFQTVPLSSLFNSQKMNFQLVCCFVTQLKSIDSVNVIFYWSFTSRTAVVDNTKSQGQMWTGCSHGQYLMLWILLSILQCPGILHTAENISGLLELS